VKRAFDFVCALCGLIALSPLFIIVSLCVWISSKGSVFYTQKRVGKGNKDFSIYKFRSMRVGADKKGLLSFGRAGKDRRVTTIGYIIRKYKIDELPQLFNVLKGDMSFVGPRPEVRKYVLLYTPEQKRVLDVRPGITDVASIAFANENDILSKHYNPEQYYIDVIMPKKIEMNLDYIDHRSLRKDIKIILRTLFV
jgi:Sugar transferases involved in lipopolysaccharide synthesis